MKLNSISKRLGLAVLSAVMVLLTACGKREQAAPQASAPAAQPPTQTATPQASVAPAPRPSPAATAPVIALPNFAALVKQEGPAVVNISTTQTVRRGGGFPGMSPDDPFYEFFRRFAPPDSAPEDMQTRSLGSGFIISADGYILTNAHVVDNADEVIVRLTDKRDFKAKVIGADERTDVALLKIEAKDLPVVRVGDASRLEVGEWVVAIGSPFGFDNTVTQGIVSAKGRALPNQNYVPFLQTDVPINPGNSGGPLFNLSGEVVGINSQIYSRSGGYMGLSFAIPIDLAIKIKNDLQAHGKVRRGRIGVVVQDVDKELAESFGMSKATGALVSSVEPGGPAERAGIQAGDVILKLDGKEIEGSADLSRAVAAVSPGNAAKLEIWRKGAVKQLELKVGELGVRQAAARGPEEARKSERIGLGVRELTAQEKRQLGTEGNLVIENVRGQAAVAGLRPGDVLLALNNDRIESIEEFQAALGKAERSAALLVEREGRTIFVPIRIKDS